MTSLADKAILLGADNHEENRVTRPKKYSELSTTKAIQADCDVKATNIILQGLSPEVYALISTHKVEKELWERIQMLMQGTSLTKQERELNTKFLNTLPPEWSKFVTDVKLVRDVHTTNVDQLHAYLGQHEYHANEYASQTQSSTPLSITYPSNDFQSSIHHNVYNPSLSIPQVEYAPSVHQQSDFSQPDTGLVVPVFQKGDDPIDAINHMMSFLTAVVTLRYPPTNNKLRNSSNPHQQATINNGRGKKGIVCYNCKGEGHMSKQCTMPKWKRDEAWFKDKGFKEFSTEEQAMTSDHNSSELGIYDYNNKQSSSKLVSKVVPPVEKTATSRQKLELLFHHHITMLRMTSLADKAIPSGTDNRPPMLEKDMYDSWKSKMELYILKRQHGRMILESIENGPLLWPTVEENGVTRPKKYSELSTTEAIQADCDVKATNIILQGLPPEVYALVSTHKVTKELWERIQMLMQGTSLTKQERECKLYNEFDKFAYKKGESLRNFYLRFSLFLNDMNIYNMKLE
nr:hypothetical protein [Tanacetum cinerariifolium]